MSKIKIILIFICLTLNFAISQAQNLTKKEKVDDFLYLYQTLKNNYPFFGVKKRTLNLDWINYKNEYLKRIRNTKNDFEFIKELKSILNDLDDGHISFSPTLYHSNYIEIYKKTNVNYYAPWIEELESVDGNKAIYWKSIIDSVDNAEKSKRKIETQTIEENSKIEFIKDSITQTAIIKIPTFNPYHIETEKDSIANFLKEISDYKSLIIDIQGNGGGSTSYWKDNLVSKLIKDTIYYKTYIAIKNGNYTDKFFKYSDEEKKNISNFKFSDNLPAELKTNDYYIIEKNSLIGPNNPVLYNGRIYLLVDKSVFSASESFAIFCKTTNWAEVVGQLTNGGGGGTDPLVVALPQSGIIINFGGTMSLNPDFTINEETKTIPDIEIKGKTKEERLRNLLNYIEEKTTANTLYK